MIVSKAYIDQHLGELVEGGDPKCIQQANYDLRVGDEIYLSEEKLPTRLSHEEPHVLIPPGQFAIVKTLEQVKMPCDMIGLISIRNKYKLQGLVNVSGFHVDPTYSGHLLFAVQNVGPNDIRLEYKAPTFMILWAKIEPSYGGEARKTGYDRIPLDFMAQLGGSSITLAAMRKEIDSLSVTVKVLLGLAGSALIGVFLLLLRATAGGK